MRRDFVRMDQVDFIYRLTTWVTSKLKFGHVPRKLLAISWLGYAYIGYRCGFGLTWKKLIESLVSSIS